jgi:hypothetical protein
MLKPAFATLMFTLEYKTVLLALGPYVQNPSGGSTVSSRCYQMAALGLFHMMATVKCAIEDIRPSYTILNDQAHFHSVSQSE